MGIGDFVCGSRGAPDECLRVLSNLAACCYGAAEDGPTGCTCWVPVYDQDQAEPRPDEPAGTRDKMCADCAYRPTSPERNGDDRYSGSGEGELEQIVRSSTFWCHQGMRKPLWWRHETLGIMVPAEVDAYKPPILLVDDQPVPFKADGSPGDRCAGWAALRRLNADTVASFSGENFAGSAGVGGASREDASWTSSREAAPRPSAPQGR